MLAQERTTCICCNLGEGKFTNSNSTAIGLRGVEDWRFSPQISVVFPWRQDTDERIQRCAAGLAGSPDSTAGGRRLCGSAD